MAARTHDQGCGCEVDPLALLKRLTLAVLGSGLTLAVLGLGLTLMVLG